MSPLPANELTDLTDDSSLQVNVYGEQGASNIESKSSISVDEAIELIGFGKFQRRVLWAAGLCFTADATEVMLLSFLSLTLQSEWELSPRQTASMTACVFAGSLVGTLTLGYLGDHVGRRPAFLLSSAIISLFGVFTAFATGYASLLGIRFAVGFGVGGLTVPFDIFAEFLPKKHRGKQLLFIEYFWTLGSLMTPLFAYLVLETSWRLFVILCAIPCVISGFMGLCLVPESPRWLISVGKADKAMAILRRAATVNGIDVDVQFHEGVNLRNEKVEESGFLDLLSQRWRKLTILLWLTWIGYAIGYYGCILLVTRVFDAEAVEAAERGEGGTPTFDYRAIFISASAEVLGLFIVIHTVDRMGRIPSQTASYIFGGGFLFSFAMLAGTASNSTLTGIAFCARMFEMMGSCVTWVSTAEILTTEIRTTGHSTANAMGRLGAFCSPYLIGTDNPIKSVGVTMLVIHFITALCAWNLPESKGKDLGHTSLEDVANDETDDSGNEMAFRYDETPQEIEKVIIT